jgi:hypothetical protein
MIELDEDITPLDTNNNPPLNVQDPITRAQARQLNLEVSSFLNSSSYDYKNTSQEGGPNQLTSGLFLGSRSSLC